jgi:protein TonB
MWEQTLIESKGYGRNKKTRWTIPVAAFLHVGVIVAVILTSYWHLEALEAPASSVSYLQTIPVVMTPTRFGVHHQAASNPNQQKVQPQHEVQPNIIPQLDTTPANEPEPGSSDIGDSPGSDLPEGDPNGVPYGDPTSTSTGGFGLAPPIGEEAHVIVPGISEPKLIKRVEPEYPRAALITRVEGIVILEAIITKTGTVEQVKTMRADYAVLERAARDAVLQWRYQPATLNGQPVKVYFTVTVTFHMR